MKLGNVLRVAVFVVAALALVGNSSAEQDSGTATEVRLVDNAWTEISPPVDHAFVPLINYGFHWMDGAKPDSPLTLYVGTCGYGIWKTTNGGSTWRHVSTGRNGWRLGNGTRGSSRNWSVAVDPTDSNVLYTVDGFGSSQGLWKSTNGGVDWDPLLSDALARSTTSDIANITIDPSDHLHLLVTSHGPWSGHADSGFIESFDGGVSWKLHPPLPGWSMGPEVEFLGQDDEGRPSKSHWLLASQSGGIWRTTDAGKTWVRVSEYNRAHAGFGLYRARNGVLYMGIDHRLVRSADNGLTWADANAPNSPDAYAGIVGDGTLLWTMPSNGGVASSGPYNWLVSPESDGTSWKAYSSQTFSNGPLKMIYDPIKRRLYAAQWSTGIWMLQR